jgi:PAS domain S-box-containing protein
MIEIKKLSDLNSHLKIIKTINELLRKSDLSNLINSLCQILRREGKYIDVVAGISEGRDKLSGANFHLNQNYDIYCVKRAIKLGNQLVVEPDKFDCRGCHYRNLSHFAAVSPFSTSAGRMFLCVISKYRFSEEEIELFNEVIQLITIAVDRIRAEELNASLLRNSDGEPYGIIGITRDITERKQIEEALKRSEQTLKGILKASPVGIGIADKRVIKFVNTRFGKMLGYSPVELIGKNSKFLYEDDGEYERVGRIIYSQIRKKGIGLIETRFKRKDGKVIDVLLSASAIDVLDDSSKEIIFTVMDITETKEARTKLEENEKKYRTIFENTGTAMAIIEEDTTISIVNSEFERLSGYNKGEIEGKMSWTQFVHPDDLDRMKKYHYTRRTGAEVPKKYEFKAISKDGNIKDILITVDIIPGTSKSVVSLIEITQIRRINKLLKAISEINEVVAKGKHPDFILKIVCEKLSYAYDAAFTSLLEDGRLTPIFSKGIDIESIKNSLKLCPSILNAIGGKTGKMNTDDALCRNCTVKNHRYVLSVPLIYDKNYGVITVYSNSEFCDDEIELLEKMSLNIAFALNAYGIEEDRRRALDQLLRNLIQFDHTADRLRNPLAVIISSIELVNEIGKERVLEMVKEQAFRIKDELDVLRREEIRTHSLIQKSLN